MINWTATTSDGVVTVRFDPIGLNDRVWILLRSDAHHDSPYCRRDIESKHLDKAKERGALIFDVGDTFDAMQGKFDPRRSMDDVREEDRVANYYDSIVTHAAEDYMPYAHNFAMFGRGNHENAVRDKANTDLISNLVYRLNSEANSKIVPGNVGGWIRLMFKYHTTKQRTYRIRYHHGTGTSAPVTRGVIETNRQAVFLRNPDIVVNGHNHQSYTLPIKGERLSPHGKIVYDVVWYVRTPGYKDEWAMNKNGFAASGNKGPTPIGSIWLKFYVHNDDLLVEPIASIE